MYYYIFCRKHFNTNYMAKIISIVNHKGGVGKTATTANLGGILTKKGYKTLLIDMDAQANLTLALGLVVDIKKTIYQALKGVLDSQYSLPIYTNADGLHVVPSCLDLSAAETELLGVGGRELILSELLATVTNDYDYILIDCPPSMSLLTLNAMTASNSILIPVQTEYLAKMGMDGILKVFNMVKTRLNKKLYVEGILFTIYDGRKNLHVSVTEMIRADYKDICPIFETVIRSSVVIGEAIAEGRDLVNYKPGSLVAKDYIAFCDELLKKDHHE